MFSWAKIFVISFLFSSVIAVSYFFYILSPANSDKALQKIAISPGTGLNEIVDILKSYQLIRSEGAFKIYSFLSGSAHLLKPGIYSIGPSATTPEIVRALVSGPLDISFLITEGKAIKDVERQLVDLGLVRSGELVNFPVANLYDQYQFLSGVKTLEGFLFPDTYRIAPGSSVQLIVKKFLDNFQDKALPVLENSFSVNGFGDWYQSLIAASLIEREIPLNEDRRLVAGIIKRRLALGIALQVDATVTYVKCGFRFDNCPLLTKNDLKIKSVYNTYFYPGLPPAPIANPGVDAIVAALNPKISSYLYYLSDPKTKKTVFARTLEEHNINKARYLAD